MMEIAVFAIVLALVFAAKAIAIVRTHDEIAEKSATFSWASMRAEDAQRAQNWESEEAASRSESRYAVGAMRRIGSAGA